MNNQHLIARLQSILTDAQEVYDAQPPGLRSQAKASFLEVAIRNLIKEMKGGESIG